MSLLQGRGKRREAGKHTAGDFILITSLHIFTNYLELIHYIPRYTDPNLKYENHEYYSYI